MPESPILVLGATGRIGGVLRRCWPDGAGRWQTRRAEAGPGWVQVDPLGDPGALARAASGCGAVLCLAGVTDARAEREADYDLNIALALAAVRAGAAADVPVLLASSAAVYGRRAGPRHEAEEVAPLGPYGRAKLEMERAAARLGEELGVAVTSLRIGNIAGLDAILGGWREGFTLDRFADGRTPRRSYVGPGALAALLLALARHTGLPPVLNLALPGAVEMGALLDAAGLPWVPRPAGAGAIPEVELDTALLGSLLPLDARPARPEELVADWRETLCGDD